jgi:hypothetical protein
VAVNVKRIDFQSQVQNPKSKELDTLSTITRMEKTEKWQRKELCKEIKSKKY